MEKQHTMWSLNSCRMHPKKTVETLQWWQWSDIKIFHADPTPATLILSCWRHCLPADVTAILALGSLCVSAATITWEHSGDLCFFLILTPESGVDERDCCEGKNEYLAVLVSILRVRLGLPLRRGFSYWEVKKTAKHALKSVLAPTPLTWALPPMVKKNFPPTN